jgi:hypothetical protein
MRSTKAELAKRVNEVLKLRLGGAEFPDLREHADAPEQAWGVSDTQLRRYIAAADKLCRDYFDARADHLLARHLLQRRQLYAHCVGAGDFRTALAVLKDEAELEALYPPKKVAPTDPSGQQEYAGGMTDADRLAALNNLHARVGQGAGSPPAGEQAGPGGPVLGGPGAAAGGGGDAAGPVAGGPAAAPRAADAAPLLPPGGQEPDRGRPGPAGGAA